MEEEIQAALGADAEVELIASSGGVFEITVNGKKIFSKKQSGRFPDQGEVVGLLQQ